MSKKHEIREIPVEEVLENRSKAYTFINFEAVAEEITRVEVITEQGRELVKRGRFEFSLQDEDKTLKIFKI